VEGITRQLAVLGRVFSHLKYNIEMKVAQDVIKDTGNRIAFRIAEFGSDSVL
jgi:hypothetical protein